MRLPRRRRDCSKLREADAPRDSDREDFYPRRLRPVRFQQRFPGVDVCPPVRHENHDPRDPGAGAQSLAEHGVVRGPQGGRYVRVTARQVEVAHGVDDVGLVVVGLEEELRVDPVAEQQNADLRQLR